MRMTTLQSLMMTYPHICLNKTSCIVVVTISQPFFEIGTSVPIYVELWYVSTKQIGTSVPILRPRVKINYLLDGSE
jgi:hypothetical protein